MSELGAIVPPIREANPHVHVLADTRMWSIEAHGAESQEATDLVSYLRPALMQT